MLKVYYKDDHCVKSVCIRSYSVRILENADENNSECGQFLHSGQYFHAE